MPACFPHAWKEGASFSLKPQLQAEPGAGVPIMTEICACALIEAAQNQAAPADIARRWQHQRDSNVKKRQVGRYIWDSKKERLPCSGQRVDRARGGRDVVVHGLHHWVVLDLRDVSARNRNWPRVSRTAC